MLWTVPSTVLVWLAGAAYATPTCRPSNAAITKKSNQVPFLITFASYLG
jgi:hypothetical protein